MASELVMKNVSKNFGGVQALKNVSISFNAGEVHAIIGENGAGKSTFINILSGALLPTEGEIEIWGQTFSGLSPQQAINLGIATVHQELTQFDDMTVADNVCMTSYLGKKGFVNKTEINRKTEELLKNFDLDIRATDLIRDLSTANKQIVEIAKALNLNAKVIILDEPTAAMTVMEQQLLFKIIKRLQAKGITVIYISHILKELECICDRVSVLRDGSYIATYPINEMPIDRMISLMVGRELGDIYVKKDPCSEEVVLQAEHISGNGVHDISFELHRGEILGFAGLVGAGRTELMHVIYGAAKKESGKIYLYGKEVEIKSTGQAIKLGIGLIPEDRKNQGVFLDKPIVWNITLVKMKKFCKSLFRIRKLEQAEADYYAKTLRIKTESTANNASSLSGGNQQKVVMAKTLSGNPDILIFDEPTKGVDVGARKEIYQLMIELTKQGKSIIMVSSEMGELLGVSERIIVLHEGHFAGEVTKSDFCQDRILNKASGIDNQ